MVDVERLWDEAEVVWGAWQAGWSDTGAPIRFRGGSATIRRDDLSTETSVVMEQRVYLQTETYEEAPDGTA